MKSFIEKFNRETYANPTDGWVFEYDDLKYGKSLGSTSHHDRKMIALKPEAYTVETTFRGIEYNVSRSGRVSVTAHFAPIAIDNTTVTKASVHNVDIFNSFEFAVFLPIVFLLYWFVFGRSLRFQNLFVVVVSYIFYGWWDWRFLLLIAFTSFCSWLSGLLISRYKDDGQKPKVVNVANIVLNLGVLSLFKYHNFFVSSFADVFLDGDASGLLLNVVLPVGISFYTFQALSYSIDVYRRKLEPTSDIVQFFAYVSFFPQLVAGPIERATNLLPQFSRPRTFNYAQAVDGCRQILWGLFKKIVVADNCATYVDQVWANYQNECGSTLALAAILFAFQIYGDFSGYSDIAIGSAKLFGIRLRDNFLMPYFSRNVAEFWKR